MQTHQSEPKRNQPEQRSLKADLKEEHQTFQNKSVRP